MSRGKRNRWLKTFVEGEFYYYNGLDMYGVPYTVSRERMTNFYCGIKPEDYILVKCIDPQLNNTMFLGQVVFGNEYLSVGRTRNFNKAQFYRMQKIVDDNIENNKDEETIC